MENKTRVLTTVYWLITKSLSKSVQRMENNCNSVTIVMTSFCRTVVAVGHMGIVTIGEHWTNLRQNHKHWYYIYGH